MQFFGVLQWCSKLSEIEEFFPHSTYIKISRIVPEIEKIPVNFRVPSLIFTLEKLLRRKRSEMFWVIFQMCTDWHTCDKTQTCRQYKWISLTAELPFFLGYSHVSWIFVYWTFDLRLVHSIQPFHYYQFAQFYQDLKKSREQNSICVYLSRLKFLDPSLTTWGMISSSSSSNSSTFILIWCWKRPWMS